jgi:hypothetical protein
MNLGEERVLSELQSALDALAKASEYLERASQESTASRASGLAVRVNRPHIRCSSRCCPKNTDKSRFARIGATRSPS